MDFTVKKYTSLLQHLMASGYTFQTFTEFLESPAEKVIILRHDVDDKKLNSLHFAEIQHKEGIKGTYFFRIVPQSYDEKVILRVAELGHEIGYHYEDMDLVSSRLKVKSLKFKEEELVDAALESFKNNLDRLRKLYPVKTICMHGSPRSKFDNKAIWKKYNYRDFGIIGEPYFDLDFKEIFYLTDTGRRWDGDKVSVRDKVGGSKFEVRSLKFEVQGSEMPRGNSHLPPIIGKLSLRFHSTDEIIKSAINNRLPDKIMFTFHPQRWTDRPIPWIKELVFQNMKNQIKKYYIKKT